MLPPHKLKQKKTKTLNLLHDHNIGVYHIFTKKSMLQGVAHKIIQLSTLFLFFTYLINVCNDKFVELDPLSYKKNIRTNNTNRILLTNLLEFFISKFSLLT